MILLVFATLIEANGTIQALEAVEIAPSVYKWSKGVLVIAGIGCIAAATAVILHSKEAHQVINIGIAGALNPHLILGKTYQVSKVSKHTLLPSDTLPTTLELVQGVFPFHHLSDREDGVHLISSDYPIYDSTSRQLLSSYDLVDMEGYGVSSACRLLNKPCTLFKKVSDFSRKNDSLLIKKHLSRHSALIGKEIIDLMLRRG